MNNDDGHKNGFSLIEAAIVLGVVGLVIGGIWVAAAAVAESNRQTKAVEQIGQIIRNIQTKFPRQMPASTVTIPLLAQTGCSYCWGQDVWSLYIPQEMIVAGQMLPVGPWDKVRIRPDIEYSSQQIRIQIFSLSRSSCIRLAPRLYAVFHDMFVDDAMSQHIMNDSAWPLDTPSLASDGCYLTDPDNPDSAYIQFVVEL